MLEEKLVFIVKDSRKMAEISPAVATNGDGPIGSDNHSEQGTPPPSSSKPQSKASAQAAQMKKLREANEKYKNLLKMAKERIQQQEEEMDQLRRMLGAKLFCFLVFFPSPTLIFFLSFYLT